jgi:hypothetical protein
MTVKKTPAKKQTVAKKTPVKTASVSATAKSSTKVSNFEKSLDKIMTMLQKKLPFVKQIMELSFVKSFLSSKIIEDTNKWVKTNLEQICTIIGWVILVFG